MDVNLWWGDMDHRARVTIQTAKRDRRLGRPHLRSDGRPIYLLRNIELRVEGDSAHEFGRAKVEGAIDLRPDEVLQLFEALIQSAKGQSNLKRAIRALVAEMDFEV
ncbi:hypothetical protein [Devosia sp.]|uniref:hypothetical protein n=1 Tax=Devosia sp. TaxID=1871048 RepID=UPI00292DC01B|nr:hypothetical protein [Devosia sp.]